MSEKPQQIIVINGVPVPLDMAGKAVARCIQAIHMSDRLIRQGFASEAELRALRECLTGEDEEQNVAHPDGTVS